MNWLALSLVFLLGETTSPTQVQPPAIPAEAPSGCPICNTYDCPCGKVRDGMKRLFSPAWDWFGPMPQTCYQPRFGCYPGNARDIHRYPAFHGYYYRQPYNYRHYFEYPWHALPHEPVAYFTHPGVSESIQEYATPIEAPPVPTEAPNGTSSDSSAHWRAAPPEPLPVGILSAPWQLLKPTPIRN